MFFTVSLSPSLRLSISLSRSRPPSLSLDTTLPRDARQRFKTYRVNYTGFPVTRRRRQVSEHLRAHRPPTRHPSPNVRARHPPHAIRTVRVRGRLVADGKPNAVSTHTTVFIENSFVRFRLPPVDTTERTSPLRPRREDMAKPSTWSVTLNRDGKFQPWGIRLAGGADLNTPLIITKVRTAVTGARAVTSSATGTRVPRVSSGTSSSRSIV